MDQAGLEFTETSLPLLELKARSPIPGLRSSKFLAKRACHGLERLNFLVPADTSMLGPLYFTS